MLGAGGALRLAPATRPIHATESMTSRNGRRSMKDSVRAENETYGNGSRPRDLTLLGTHTGSGRYTPASPFVAAVPGARQLGPQPFEGEAAALQASGFRLATQSD